MTTDPSFRPPSPANRLPLRRPPWVLALALAACGGNGGTSTPDGGQQPQADMATASPDLAMAAAASHHMSFVPATEMPADAARLLVLGDSISVGNGATGSALSYAHLLVQNADDKWPAEAKTTLTAKYGHNVDLVNLAVGGATTQSMLSQLPMIDQKLGSPVQGHTIVTITIGGNDLQNAIISYLGNPSYDPAGQDLDDAINNISQAIDYLQDKTRFPDGTSIYLMAVYDPSDGVGQADGCFLNQNLGPFVPALDTWRMRYEQLGMQKGFAVIDALGAFHGHGFHYNDKSNQYYDATDPELWFYRDCIHPDDAGHNELRRLFFEAIDGGYKATDP